MKTLLIAALLGAVAMPALAQTGPVPGGAGHMNRADADGDGVITRAEAQAMADARFDRLDTNHDGRITADEMPTRGPGGGAPGMASPPPGGPEMAGRMGRGVGAGMLRRADANGDGVITRDEFRAAEARRFDMMDANHDGKIDAAEREQFMQAMRDRMAARGARGGGDMPPPPPSAPQQQ